jgi:hypothetical protein
MFAVEAPANRSSLFNEEDDEDYDGDEGIGARSHDSPTRREGQQATSQPRLKLKKVYAVTETRASTGLTTKLTTLRT